MVTPVAAAFLFRLLAAQLAPPSEDAAGIPPPVMEAAPAPAAEPVPAPAAPAAPAAPSAPVVEETPPAAAAPEPAAAPVTALVPVLTHRPLGISGITGQALAILRQRVGVGVSGPAAVQPVVPAVRSMLAREVLWQRENVEVVELSTADGAPQTLEQLAAMARARQLEFTLLVQLADPAPNGAVASRATLQDRNGATLWQMDGPQLVAMVPEGDVRMERARARQAFHDEAWILALDAEQGMVLVQGRDRAVPDEQLPLSQASVAEPMKDVRGLERLQMILGGVACAVPLGLPVLCGLPTAAVGTAVGVVVMLAASLALPLPGLGAVLGGLAAGAAVGAGAGCLAGCVGGGTAGLFNRAIRFVAVPARRMEALQAAQDIHNREVATRLGLSVELLPGAYFPSTAPPVKEAPSPAPAETAPAPSLPPAGPSLGE